MQSSQEPSMPISTPHSPRRPACRGLLIHEEWMNAAAGKTLARSAPEEPGITK